VARYNGPAGGDNEARAVAVDPGGRRVFVTGQSYGGRATGADYATVAYSAATGRRLWVGRFAGNRHVTSRNRDDIPTSMAVSPGGRRVFVTGYSHGRGTGYDYATLGYDAATGRLLWVRRYNFAGSGDDFANAVAVSPDGTTVYVTGDSSGDYATVAYSAATGRRLWVRRHGPANRDDDASSVAVSPDGTTVFVTGSSQGGTSGYMATVAYSATAGRQLWVSRYNRPDGAAESVAVSPDGTTVYVTGSIQGRTGFDNYATVAYSAADGTQLWVRRYKGDAWSVAVSPDGTAVFVTGSGDGGYATVAYRG